jgi:hypothetical protein
VNQRFYAQQFYSKQLNASLWMPSGSMPSGSMPSGSMPSGSMPAVRCQRFDASGSMPAVRFRHAYQFAGDLARFPCFFLQIIDSLSSQGDFASITDGLFRR